MYKNLESISVLQDPFTFVPDAPNKWANKSTRFGQVFFNSTNVVFCFSILYTCCLSFLSQIFFNSLFVCSLLLCLFVERSFLVFLFFFTMVAVCLFYRLTESAKSLGGIRERLWSRLRQAPMFTNHLQTDPRWKKLMIPFFVAMLSLMNDDNCLSD